MKITTRDSTDHKILSCVNDFYTLRWYYHYGVNKLAKYHIDSVFFEETGYMVFDYDDKWNLMSCRSFLMKENGLKLIKNIQVRYNQEEIVFYVDQDGNWYDKEEIGSHFPYEDPRALIQQVEQALKDIEKNGTTELHFITEPDFTRYE